MPDQCHYEAVKATLESMMLMITDLKTKVRENCHALENKASNKFSYYFVGGSYGFTLLLLVGLVAGYKFMDVKLENHVNYATAQCEAIKGRMFEISEKSNELGIIFSTIQKSLEKIENSQMKILEATNTNSREIERLKWEKEREL